MHLPMVSWSRARRHAWVAVVTAAVVATTIALVAAPRATSSAPGVAMPPPWAVDAGSPVAISGQVFVDDVPGVAIVHVRLELADDRAWVGLELLSDVDGRFATVPLPRGRYQLLAETPGGVSSVAFVDTARSRTPSRELFVYPCIRVVHRVYDRDGRPVPGTVIALGGVRRGETDVDGVWRGCVAADQEDWVTLRAPGQAARRFRSTRGPWRLTPYLADFEARVDDSGPEWRPWYADEHVDCKLGRRGRIVSRGVPVAGARVRLSGPGRDDGRVVTVFTDHDGRFEIPPVLVGGGHAGGAHDAHHLWFGARWRAGDGADAFAEVVIDDDDLDR